MNRVAGAYRCEPHPKLRASASSCIVDGYNCAFSGFLQLFAQGGFCLFGYLKIHVLTSSRFFVQDLLKGINVKKVFYLSVIDIEVK